MFLAERDGSVLAFIGDMDALMDQAGTDAANDENWQAIPAVMPGTNVAVTVVIRFSGK